MNLIYLHNNYYMLKVYISLIHYVLYILYVATYFIVVYTCTHVCILYVMYSTVAMHTVPDLRNLRNLTTAIITILP